MIVEKPEDMKLSVVKTMSTKSLHSDEHKSVKSLDDDKKRMVKA